MDFRLTTEEESFRQEFRAWLDKILPDGWDPFNQPTFKEPEKIRDAYKDFQRKLAKAGYAGMHYDKTYGGQGRSIMEGVIVSQEIGRTCISLAMPGVITHGMALPLIYFCGTEEQKQKFIPNILDGSHLWCQGFSEPDAGSDVANVSTTAIRDGNVYVVNGQKVWTSMAHFADFCLLVVRTDPESRKHKGLSYLLVDMSLPGIDPRPMTQITGEAEFNEVFFDNVRVPVSSLIGEEGQGWKMAITTLMFERAMGDVVISAAYETNFARLIRMASQTKSSGRPVIEDPVYRQQIAQAYIEIMALKYHGLRNFSSYIKTGIPGPEGSIGKLLWSEPNQRITEAAVNMQGPAGQVTGGPWSIQNGHWQYAFLRSKGNTIEAGTSEIQRNIIGERVLGLPKDAARN
jgi:alkylation response protein AidB-like acyl-CoA dehydrogenase